MNAQDMLLAQLAEIDKGGFPYQVSLMCQMNKNLVCPDAIRAQFPESVNFTVNNTLDMNVTWDWEKRVLSFYASFSGVRSLLSVPAENLMSIISPDNSVIGFGHVTQQPQQPQTIETSQQPQTIETSQQPQTIETSQQPQQPQQPESERVKNTTEKRKSRKPVSYLKLVVDNT